MAALAQEIPRVHTLMEMKGAAKAGTGAIIGGTAHVMILKRQMNAMRAVWAYTDALMTIVTRSAHHSKKAIFGGLDFHVAGVTGVKDQHATQTQDAVWASHAIAKEKRDALDRMTQCHGRGFKHTKYVS